VSQLNHFFSHFEVDAAATVTLAPATDSQPLTLHLVDVRRTLRNINTQKTAGPNGVPGRFLRECAAELADVFLNMFNLSLLQYSVPMCLKTSTIVPDPKQAAVTSLNDYRPVALKPVIMKCIERLVLNHIKAGLPPILDPHQYT